MEGLIGIVTEVCLYAFNVGFVFSMGGYMDVSYRLVRAISLIFCCSDTCK